MQVAVAGASGHISTVLVREVLSRGDSVGDWSTSIRVRWRGSTLTVWAVTCVILMVAHINVRSHWIAAYAVSGKAKKERTRQDGFCILMRWEKTIRFKWSGPAMVFLSTPWCFRWFQPCSSGLSSG